MFKFLFSPGVRSESERIPVHRSSVRGATGLSREALTAMVVRDGLFGRDSVFGVTEQRAILAQLGVMSLWRGGGAKARVSRAVDGLLPALHAFVEDATCGAGTVSRAEWRAAGDAGLSTAQRGEVLAVVGLLRETLGLVRSPLVGDAREAAVAISNAADLQRVA